MYNVNCTDVDSSGNIQTKVESASTANAWDKAVQVIRLTSDINGPLVWPENTEAGVDRACNILDVQSFNVFGSSGNPPIDYRDTETPLFIKGNGFLSAAAALPISSGTQTNANTNFRTTNDDGAVTVAIDDQFTFNVDVTSPSPGQQHRSNNAIGGVIAMDNTGTQAFTDLMGGTLLTNMNANFRLQMRDAFPEDNPRGGGLIVGPGGQGQDSYNVGNGRVYAPVVPSSDTTSGSVRTITWSGAGFDPRQGVNYTMTMTSRNGLVYIVISHRGDTRYNIGAGINVRQSTPGRRYMVTNGNSFAINFTAGIANAVTIPASTTSPVTINSASTVQTWSFTGSRPAATSFRFPASGFATGSDTDVTAVESGGNGTTSVAISNYTYQTGQPIASAAGIAVGGVSSASVSSADRAWLPSGFHANCGQFVCSGGTAGSFMNIVGGQGFGNFTAGSFITVNGVNRFESGRTATSLTFSGTDVTLRIGGTFSFISAPQGSTSSVTRIRVAGAPEVDATGRRYTTNNGNSVPITVTRDTGQSFTVAANFSGQVNQFEDTNESWTFQGTLGATNSDGNPLANTPSFVDNAAVDLNADGDVTRGVTFTEFNGTYARTGG